MEEIREELNRTIDIDNLLDPETIRKSQQLDVEIVEYIKKQMTA